MNLTPSDLSNGPFDRQRPVYRKSGCEQVIEGTTFTDNFQLLGWTYHPKTGALSIKTTKNVVVFDGRIKTVADFERAIKKVDKKAS